MIRIRIARQLARFAYLVRLARLACPVYFACFQNKESSFLTAPSKALPLQSYTRNGIRISKFPALLSILPRLTLLLNTRRVPQVRSLNLGLGVIFSSNSYTLNKAASHPLED